MREMSQSRSIRKHYLKAFLVNGENCEASARANAIETENCFYL